MKSTFALLSLACLAVSRPLSSPETSEQVFLGGLEEHSTNYPGFDIDLTSQRLIQLEGREPIWMTELEKVWHLAANFSFTNLVRSDSSKSSGIKFFDM
jgi:leucyl aminopeptidase